MKKLKKKYLLISLLILIIPLTFALDSIIWDDCEDLNNEGAVWTAIRGDETITNTATEKYGTNAIAIKGGALDYPGVYINFATPRDWSSYKTFEIWVAPLNDDGTPAMGKTARIYIYDSDLDVMTYDVVLSGTPDTYIIKRCEVNNSGEGDSGSETGTMDWTIVDQVHVRIVSTDNNIDMAYDHVTLTYYKPYQVNWGIWTQFTLIGTIVYSGIFIMLVSAFYIMIIGK